MITNTKNLALSWPKCQARFPTQEPQVHRPPLPALSPTALSRRLDGLVSRRHPMVAFIDQS
jgi:hypothetical protein